MSRELAPMVEAALPFPSIDPEIVRFGPLAIRWYALAYIAGLLLGWYYIVRLLEKHSLWAGKPFKGKAPATADHIGDLFVWITLGVIIGGRLGFVIFYGVLYCGFAGELGTACGGLPWGFVENPLRIIAAWEGGMSFHGGLIGVVTAVILFCRRHKLQLLSIADLIAAATPIGLFFGRIANFINGELWGKITDVSWGVVFCNDVILEQFGRCPAGTEPRHPSQIYEALLEGALLFAILRIAMVRFALHRRPGLLTALFMAGYGVFRFAVEFFRDSESKIYEWFSVGQALSIPMVLAAALFAWYAYHASSKASSKALGTKTVK
jgi:phosphatidylglycerol:prolipoprotein diacylglycerol transferase